MAKVPWVTRDPMEVGCMRVQGAGPVSEHLHDTSEMYEEVLRILKESAEIGEIKEPADLDVLTKQMEETLKDLNDKADKLCEATGLTREQLREFSENPDNFSEKEWQLLMEVRSQVDVMQDKAEKIALGTIDEGMEPPPSPRKKQKPKPGGPKRPKRKDWMAG